MRSSRVAALAALIVLACGPCPHAAAQPGVLRVDNGQLTRDGQPFTVKGVQIVGLVAPAATLVGMFKEAHAHYSSAELGAARAWGANTIRFQLSQGGLDRQGPSYSREYEAQVVEAIRTARSLGFAVIASLQSQMPPASRPPVQMPSAATLHALATLVSQFHDDRGVMIELFNEPQLNVSPRNWELWLRGGTLQGAQLVGTQVLVAEARRLGAENVLIAEGLGQGRDLSGMPDLRDDTGQLAFGVHPYLRQNGTQDLWQRRFGDLVDRGRLVIATEWSTPTGRLVAGVSDLWCDGQPMDTPKRLLEFLRAKRIGIVGWAFDVPGSIVKDFDGTPTSLEGAVCGRGGFGPGELLREQFASP